MYRILLTLAFIRKRRNAAIAIGALAVFAVVVTMALVLIQELKTDVGEYETQLAALGEKMEQYETAAQRNRILTTDNTSLENENEALENENDSLAAANSELERLNGDLLKKFDGLSKLS
ncbi:MAG: hypothetical protein LBS91_06240 [Clostridiales Family XIII bacterium]|jgi:cell division protein FtsB|nr:hypothetical protein [Clostridiales Family XIII bacterium]